MTLFPPPTATYDEPEGFAEFWEAFPRKRDKKDAVKAYRAALKTHTPAQILHARDAYLAECKAEGREPRHICYPAGLLRRKLDDYLEVPVKRERPAPVCPEHGAERGCWFAVGSGWMHP